MFWLLWRHLLEQLEHMDHSRVNTMTIGTYEAECSMTRHTRQFDKMRDFLEPPTTTLILLRILPRDRSGQAFCQTECCGHASARLCKNSLEAPMIVCCVSLCLGFERTYALIMTMPPRFQQTIMTHGIAFHALSARMPKPLQGRAAPTDHIPHTRACVRSALACSDHNADYHEVAPCQSILVLAQACKMPLMTHTSSARVLPAHTCAIYAHAPSLSAPAPASTPTANALACGLIMVVECLRFKRRRGCIRVVA